MRTAQDPVSPVEAGHRASTLGNVSDIALRLGRKLKWDPASERFVGDDAANSMLLRHAQSLDRLTMNGQRSTGRKGRTVMLQKRYCFALAILVTVVGANRSGTTAAEMSDGEAWQALPKYEYGQDMSALLAIDRAVIKAMATPETRSACAARLASLLADRRTTLPARQYICFQLRQIATPAQVPVLAEMLAQPDTSQMARYVLEQIPGNAASAALRKGLEALKGNLLLGAIDSLAVRRDEAAVPALERLADDQDQEVASAAVGALGRIGGDRAFTFLSTRAEKAPIPMPTPLAVVMLRQAHAMVESGNVESAKAIFDKLSQVGQPRSIRRAA